MTTDEVQKLAEEYVAKEYQEPFNKKRLDMAVSLEDFLAGFAAGRRAGLLRGAEIAEGEAERVKPEGKKEPEGSYMRGVYIGITIGAHNVRNYLRAEAEAGGGKEKA